jgi:hypothetical protein
VVVALTPLTQHGLVQPGEDGRGTLLVYSHRADGVTGERQDGRGFGALAAHVPDHHAPDRAGRPGGVDIVISGLYPRVEEVVEVAADVYLAGGQVAQTHLDAGYIGEARGQEAAL